MDVEQKVLEIKLRRVNPTLGEAVKVQWAVWMRDMGGRVRIATHGERELQTTVGQVIEFTSDPFELRERDIDFRHGPDGERTQEIEGYAVRILDLEGNEIGTKFQPSSIEEVAREQLKSQKATADRDWSKGPFPNRPRQIRPKQLR